ncbi:hypothetical protein BB558_000241 [Smittium angustum]|uniref:Histone-lysine N-methyltransferase n=1 Tax=Smittium angustum TaxID=133377 RepID=A0A2U1JEU2_SMIAN|nr:hypothetical protein BB558_000241 [Smittium angustum]
MSILARYKRSILESQQELTEILEISDPEDDIIKPRTSVHIEILSDDEIDFQQNNSDKTKLEIPNLENIVTSPKEPSPIQEKPACPIEDLFPPTSEPENKIDEKINSSESDTDKPRNEGLIDSQNLPSKTHLEKIFNSHWSSKIKEHKKNLKKINNYSNSVSSRDSENETQKRQETPSSGSSTSSLVPRKTETKLISNLFTNILNKISDKNLSANPSLLRIASKENPKSEKMAKKYKISPEKSHGLVVRKQLLQNFVLSDSIPAQIVPKSTENIRRFEEILNSGNKCGPRITVVNTIDDVSPPLNFVFVDESIYSGNVPRPQTIDLLSCACDVEPMNSSYTLFKRENIVKTYNELINSNLMLKGCMESFCGNNTVEEIESKLDLVCSSNNTSSSDNQTCSHNMGVGNPYNSMGLLLLDPELAIYECNSSCACGPYCFNRVVQRGPRLNLQVFRTKHKGWGVRTLQTLQEGQFIAEYVGEIITYSEADRRGKLNDKLGSTYLFDIDFETAENMTPEFTIDAEKYGNITHFLNHSCVPNLKIRAVYTNHWDSRLHQLAFFTTERIQAGTELTFDYNPSSPFPDDENYEDVSSEIYDTTYGRNHQKRSSKSLLNLPSDYARYNNILRKSKKPSFKHKGYKCYCGAPRCRGFVFNS